MIHLKRRSSSKTDPPLHPSVHNWFDGDTKDVTAKRNRSTGEFPVKRPNKKPAKNSNNTSIARNRNSNGNKSWSRREQPVQTCPAAIPHRDKRTFFFKKKSGKKCCNRPSNSSSSPGLIFQADPSSSSLYFSFLFIYFILFKFSGGKWRLICIINGISAATTISLLFFKKRKKTARSDILCKNAEIRWKLSTFPLNE